MTTEKLEQRLRTYFTRLSQDPSYTYEGFEEDAALVRRKGREGRVVRLNDRGVGGDT